MRILVYGAGGVGLGLGSFLLAAGEEVAFVGRADTVAALSARGLQRTGCFGPHVASPAAFVAASSLDALPAVAWEPAPELVLVTTKSFDSEAAARALAEHASIANGALPLVLCQNGWGNAEVFAAHFPLAQIWNARVITGFRRPEPHHVEVTVHAEPVHVGSLFGGKGAELKPLCAALGRGGLPADTTDDIAGDLWAKLLYNGCLNPTGAILGVPYGALGASRHGRMLVRAIAEEIFAVMHAAGFRTHWASPDAFLTTLYDVLLPPTASHESSTLQDLRAGKPTEIDALTGAVVRLGDTHGVATPVNRALLAMVGLREERSRSAGQ